MPSVVLQKFSGLVPRLSPRLLANGAATVASMPKMWSGELRPFRQRKVITIPITPDPENPDRDIFPTNGRVLSLYKQDDYWLAWTTDVDVVSGFTTLSLAGQIYYTGDGAPKQTSYPAYVGGPATPPSTVTYPIGVEGPTTALTVTQVAPGGGTATGPVLRSYVYTYVTTFNEESVPSPPSAVVSVDEGLNQSVNLSDWAYPSAFDTTVDRIRVYRTIGGEYFFVMELFYPPIPGLTNDNVLDSTVIGNSEPLISQHWYPPPGDIQGLIGLACGSLAAFRGNSVVFSEPYQPGAWPREYEKIFDYPIVALGTFGQTCVVATTAFTYLVSGSHPKSFSVARIPDPYPCVSKRSMVSAESGVVYASRDGLIFVGVASYNTGGTGVHVLTRSLMTKDEWSAYNPSTIMGVIQEGRYYGWYLYTHPDLLSYPGAGFIFDFNDRNEALVSGTVGDSGDKSDILIDLNFWASAAYANPQVPLHVVTQPLPSPGPTYSNVLSQWDAGDAYESLTWRSKQYSFPYAVTFSVAKLAFNVDFPIDTAFAFRLYDGVSGTLLYARSVATRLPFRLPSLSPRTDWLVEVEGTSAVQMIELASSYQDLQERKAL